MIFNFKGNFNKKNTYHKMIISGKTLKLAGLSALLIFILSNCRKDDFPKSGNNCADFPERDGGGLIGTVIEKNNQRKAPCFNPKFQNEFVYLKVEENVQSLVKSNVVSGEEETLIENTSIIGQPDWGADGKIIFSQLDRRVYSYDIHSKSLERVTNVFESIYPKIYQDSLILFVVGVETTEGASGIKKINQNGARIDSIIIGELEGVNSTPGLFDCSNNYVYAEFISTNGEYGIYSLLFENRTISPMFTGSFDEIRKITGVAQYKNEFVIYSTYRRGIFQLNSSSLNQVCIKNACDSRTYEHLSISPNGEQILAERIDATNYSTIDGSWTEESKIVIMDIDGSNERVIFN